MNRYLLAGCAVVALALGSGAANAQAKFEVKVGGDVYVEGAFIDQNRDSDLRNVEMRNRFRVNIIPSAKADNGLEYGGRIRMRAASGTRAMDADRAYIFAQGGFGQVRLGQTNSFNDETIVSRPIDYLPFGLFDQALNYTGALGGAQATINGRVNGGSTGGGLNAVQNACGGGSVTWPSLNPDGCATKVVYFSPRLAGFQLGASYTPRSDSNNTESNRSKYTALAVAGQITTGFQDLWEIGANYDATFGAVRAKAGAGYFGGTPTKTVGASYRDLKAWQAGAQLGFAGISVGGSYTDFGKSGLNRSFAFQDSNHVWQLGAQYTMGPIVVGGGWMYGQDAGSTAVAGKRKVNAYELGVSYTVAPGFAVQAQYDYVDAKNDVINTNDKGNIVILRTTLAF